MEERKNFYSQDNATELANQTNVANAKFLNYAGSVLRNSEGVRPTLPIIKAIRVNTPNLNETFISQPKTFFKHFSYILATL